MTINATPRQIQILRHSLGLSDPYAKNEYRNYYVAGEGHHGWDDLLALEAAGLMRRTRNSIPPVGDVTFTVTDAGKRLARAHAPKISRGKRMYRKFLDVSDCAPDLTFREFLTSPDYADSRAEA